MLNFTLSPRLAATLVLLLAVSPSRLAVEAFPNGAPACTVDAMRIQSGMGGQSQVLGYRIDHPATYKLGEKLTFIVNGPASYKGFLFYLSSTSQPSLRVGSFQIPNGFKSNQGMCAAGGVKSGPNGVLTHANPQLKPAGTRIEWTTSPQDVCETLEVHAVVAREKTVWEIVPVSTIRCIGGGNTGTTGASAINPTLPVPCDDDAVLSSAATKPLPPLQPLPSLPVPCDDDEGNSVSGGAQSFGSKNSAYGGLNRLDRKWSSRRQHSSRKANDSWSLASSSNGGFGRQHSWNAAGRFNGDDSYDQTRRVSQSAGGFGAGYMPMDRHPMGGPFPHRMFTLPPPPPQGLMPFNANHFPRPPPRGLPMPHQASYGPNMSQLLHKQQPRLVSSLNTWGSRGSGGMRRCRRRHRVISAPSPRPRPRPQGAAPSQQSVPAPQSDYYEDARPAGVQSAAQTPTAYPATTATSTLPSSTPTSAAVQSSTQSAYPQTSSPAGVQSAAQTAYPSTTASPSGVQDKAMASQPMYASAPSVKSAGVMNTTLAAPGADSAYFQSGDNTY